MSRILVAEDEPHILLLIQRKLESAGYEVIPSTNGEDAMKLALSDKPDLLLLDIMLPGCEGLEICRAVNATYEHQAPPVILLTALCQQIENETGMADGADDYIIKPFSPRQLLERVQSALYG